MSGIPRIVAAGQAPEPFEPVPVTEEGAPDSLIARLREQAARVQEVRLLDLPVPGWQGLLVLRFRPLDVASLDRLIGRAGDASASGINETLDAMARSCVGVYAREDDGRLEQLRDMHGPVLLEDRLAVLLTLPRPSDAELTARETVLALFERGGAFALGAFVDKLVGWMTDPDASVKPGES